MTCGVLEAPRVPRTAPADWTASRARAWRTALAVAVLALTTAEGARAQPRGRLPEGTITEVRIEGNASIPVEQIRAKIKSHAGSPLDQRLIEADLKSLLTTKWFSDVSPYYDADPKGKGYILIFAVKEMPVLSHVEFLGRSEVKLKDIEEATGLKKGARADAMRARLAVEQIRTLYHDKGYDLAEVELVEGGKPGDTRVVIRIFEGPWHKVGSIVFEGNTFASDATLETKITSRKRLFGLFRGKYHREDLEEDARKLRDYYQGLGFFDVKVTPVQRPGSTLGDVRLTFVISEGIQYRVRKLVFEGNKMIPTKKLLEGMTLHSGQPFRDTMRDVDRKTLISKYYAIGCIDTQILPEPKVTDEVGVVDLVYKIEEGEPYLMGFLDIRGNERTRDKVIRREAVMAGLLPGEVLDLNRLETFRKRLNGLQYFNAPPEQGGKPIEIKVINRRPHNKPYGDGATPEPDGLSLTRMQDPGPETPLELPDEPPAPAPGAAPASEAPAPGPAGLAPFGSAGAFDPPPDTLPVPIQVPVPVPQPVGPPPVIAAPGPGAPTPPVGAGEPLGTFPSIPGMNETDVGPDRQEAFPNRSYADLATSVDEGPTGRILFGVGATSAGGLSGNLIIHEKNFDITKFPRSFRDIGDGQAFRGAGQEFRLELSPGTAINRAVVSFRDPYLFDLPIGFGASGYIFQRAYRDFNETRGGGRFSLGRQFGIQTYADLAFRIEDVNITGFESPAPADFLAASGHTTLATLRPSIRFDNRNDPFAPNKGQYVEAAFEQGWGSFTFPKFTIEGRQYFTTGSRPDGSGKRILTTRARFGVTGRDTPVYERFYAGDFGSMRGFAFRGVGPHVLGDNVGGILTAIGSVEYQFPWTANDQLQQVVFCDFGTVEADYTFTSFRAAVGTGLRVVIPAFGQLPLAFDIAFPVSKADGDRTRYFTFFIGAFW